MSDLPRFYATSGELMGRRIEMEGDEITFGRAADNRVVIAHPEVSAHHARVYRDAQSGDYMLEDLQSRNGSSLAGARLRRPEPLGHLDSIDLGGGVELIFQVPAPDPEPAREVERAREPAHPAPVAPAPAPDPGHTRVDAAPFVLPAELAGDLAASRQEEDVRLKTLYAEDLGGWQLPAAAAATPDVSRTVAGEPAAWSLPSESVSEAPFEPSPTEDDAIVPRRTKPAEDTETELAQSLPAVALPAPDAAPAPSAEWNLEIEGDDQPPEPRRLGPGEYVLGRESSCSVVINDMTLSRRHASLSIGDHGASVTDLGSFNKTYVDERLATGPTTLDDDTRVRFGGVTVRFRRLREDQR